MNLKKAFRVLKKHFKQCDHDDDVEEAFKLVVKNFTSTNAQSNPCSHERVFYMKHGGRSLSWCLTCGQAF